MINMSQESRPEYPAYDTRPENSTLGKKVMEEAVFDPEKECFVYQGQTANQWREGGHQREMISGGGPIMMEDGLNIGAVLDILDSRKRNPQADSEPI